MNKGTFFCIDGHTCGKPVRLVTSGHPLLEGNTMGDKRLHFMREFDWIRQSLMFEPRGHDMMSGSFLYPPCSDNADASILFIETSGCLPMCGHGTIGTITAALEAGLLKPRVPGKLVVDVPAALMVIYRDDAELEQLLAGLEGQLTGSIHGSDEHIAAHRELVESLSYLVGRLIFNQMPTGVEVCDAIMHGGPFPSSTDVRSTSVGSQAIERFQRPLCIQNAV